MSSTFRRCSTRYSTSSSVINKRHIAWHQCDSKTWFCIHLTNSKLLMTCTKYTKCNRSRHQPAMLRYYMTRRLQLLWLMWNACSAGLSITDMNEWVTDRQSRLVLTVDTRTIAEISLLPLLNLRSDVYKRKLKSVENMHHPLSPLSLSPGDSLITSLHFYSLVHQTHVNADTSDHCEQLISKSS